MHTVPITSCPTTLIPPITTKLPNHDPPSEKPILLSTDLTDPSDSYEHRVIHAESIFVIVVNVRYSTPVTLKFATVTKKKSVNIAQKHVIIFSTIKIIDPSTTIKSQKGVVYHHPKGFPCN